MANDSVQKALSEVGYLRTVISRIDKLHQKNPQAVKLDLAIQIFAGCLALFLFLFEIISGHGNTELILASSQNEGIQVYGIQSLILIVTVLLVIIYFSIYVTAKKDGEDYTDYIVKNFTYLKSISFISDCALKAVILILIILAGKGEWFAPLLSLFTADYLFQGRLFRLPLKIANIAGVICLIVAGAQFYYGSTLLVYPSLIFILISAYSIRLSCLYYKNLMQIEEE